jgi:hypothetical protein
MMIAERIEAAVEGVELTHLHPLPKDFERP